MVLQRHWKFCREGIYHGPKLVLSLFPLDNIFRANRERSNLIGSRQNSDDVTNQSHPCFACSREKNWMKFIWNLSLVLNKIFTSWPTRNKFHIFAQFFSDQLSRLHMILKPFMLRRIKRDVENELSDKVRTHFRFEWDEKCEKLWGPGPSAV